MLLVEGPHWFRSSRTCMCVCVCVFGDVCVGWEGGLFQKPVLLFKVYFGCIIFSPCFGYFVKIKASISRAVLTKR